MHTLISVTSNVGEERNKNYAHEQKRGPGGEPGASGTLTPGLAPGKES